MPQTKNVWVTEFFALDHFFLAASLESQKFNFHKNGGILTFSHKTDDPELLKLKEMYFSLALERSRANHLAYQSMLLPDGLWREKKYNALPTQDNHIFSINSGGIMLNEKCADVLKSCRLGKNSLTPLKIRDFSTGEICSDDTFYFLNLYERRQYVCFPQTNSSQFNLINQKTEPCYSKMTIHDNELEIKQEALNCDVDLWHDPRLSRYFFVSDELHYKLKEANVNEGWRMSICKLV